MSSILSPNKSVKDQYSPKTRGTPRQVQKQSNVTLYYEQSRPDDFDSNDCYEEEENGITVLEKSEPDTKKRRSKNCDPLTERLLKVRKVFEDKDDNFENINSPKSSLHDGDNLVPLNSNGSTDKANNKRLDSFSCGDLAEFFNDDWAEKQMAKKMETDLTSPKRCIIIDIIWEKLDMTLTIKDVSNDSISLVKCSGLWRYTRINPGEEIIIKATKFASNGQLWIIDNNNGFLINQPNTLISGTSVVGALFCNRKSILAEKFRGIDSLPYNKVGNHYMLTGSLTHELLQHVLENNIVNVKEIKDCMENILNSKNAIEMMYEVGISKAECTNLMRPSIPQIYKFVRRYIQNIPPKEQDKNFNGCIEKICDIEENVWLPNLGLKGKIDLTVKVKEKDKTQSKVLPLEVKTGRASFSPEHRGQLILYTMMMDMTDRNINSGLLLYLRENIMQEIKGTHYERRDLLMLRNNLAYFLTREPTVLKENTNEEKIVPMELPKPINHHGCSKCPYNVLCCAYLTNEDKQDLDETHFIKQLSNTALSHLSQNHIDYVIKWVCLMQLEENSENLDTFSWKDIWLLSPEKRESRGSCFSYLNLTLVMEKQGRYIHKFEYLRGDGNEKNFTNSHFIENEYVVISTSNRINICSGFVCSITERYVEITIEKNIRNVYNDEFFHVDKSSSSALLSLSLAALGGLLDDNPLCNKLRKIVIDREPATFTSTIPENIMDIGSNIFSQLNENQMLAILKVFEADNYLLIKGFPGTGKTQTLVNLINLLVKMEKSVLVTAHTNTAVDNILTKLLDQNIDFIRLGSTSKMHSSILDKSETILTAQCDSPDSLDTVYHSKKVIGVTCYSTNHPHLSKRKFDVCIIDESTQVLQPTTLRPLFCASKFVLVGDPEQLPPIARNVAARSYGLNESLFARLDTENNTITLKTQYRMNEIIMDIANRLTYHNQLEVGNEKIAKSTISIADKLELKSSEKWVQYALSSDLKCSVVMLNTSSTHELTVDPAFQKFKISCNIWEVAITMRLVDVLVKIGVDAQDIGVIAPYRAQVNLIRKFINKNVEVNTVDQYQGRDKNIIIYSCSKSTPSDTKIQEFDILMDHQRLTVALTRAKEKLIIIGDKTTLNRYDPFQKLFKAFEEKNCIYDLKDGENDFNFEDLSVLLTIPCL